MVTSDTRCVSNITLNLPHNPVKQAPCYSFSHVWKQKLPNRNQLAEDQWLKAAGPEFLPSSWPWVSMSQPGRLGAVKCVLEGGLETPWLGGVWGTGETPSTAFAAPIPGCPSLCPLLPNPRVVAKETRSLAWSSDVPPVGGAVTLGHYPGESSVLMPLGTRQGSGGPGTPAP